MYYTKTLERALLRRHAWLKSSLSAGFRLRNSVAAAVIMDTITWCLLYEYYYVLLHNIIMYV